jgi:hypothetical protein
VIAERLIHVDAALATFLILLVGAFAFHAWIETAKDLMWAYVINGGRVSGPFTVSLTGALIATLTWLPDIPGLVLAVAVTPLLTWPLVNIVSWLRAPKGAFERAPSLLGFVRLEWSKAFLLTEQRRQREAYIAPSMLDPEAESFLDDGDV